ncbi:MAG: hypothetical protein Q7V57_02835 [Actinomycetota bacterium]|nr:hypothetical protein [Actinomycetota bacterium]
MSDFGSDPTIPPAPPAAAPPPPGYAPPAGYSPYPAAPAQKPPRPAVPNAAYLLIAGGVLMIVGSALNWFSLFGEDFNGFSEVDGSQKDGPAFVFFALVAIGAAITFLAAKRVLAVAIIACVLEVFAMFAAFADIGDVNDAMDLADTAGFEASQGAGLYVVLLGSLLALAGSIVAIAKRRR